MNTPQAVQVIFLSTPIVGERASVIIGGQPATTSAIVNVQTDPRYPDYFWTVTQSGSKYIGFVDYSQHIPPVKPDITMPNIVLQPTAIQARAANAKKPKRPVGEFIAGGLLLAMIAILAISTYMRLVKPYLMASPPEPAYYSMESKEASDAAYAFAKAFVKNVNSNRLMCPSTAKYIGGNATHMDGALFHVRGYYDAQNSFGAMLRGDYYCELKYKSQSPTWYFEVIELVIDGKTLVGAPPQRTIQ